MSKNRKLVKNVKTEDVSLSKSNQPASESKLTFLLIVLETSCTIYEKTVSVSSLSTVFSDLCLLLQELREPLRKLHIHLKRGKPLHAEIEELLQLILTSLQEIDTDVIEKSKLHRWKDCGDKFGLEHYQRLSSITKDLIHLLSQIGIISDQKNESGKDHLKGILSKSTGWEIPNISNEIPSNNLWPLIFLPDRNLQHIPRRIPIRKLEDLIIPSKPPQCAIVINQGKEGGMGKSEIILEFCYRNIEDGVYAVIIWLTCTTEASLLTSFKYLARRIVLSDPSFNEQEDYDADSLSKKELIDVIIHWIDALPMPWLIVFDGVDNSSFLSTEMFPKKSSGCIIITTSTTELTQIESKVKNISDILEINILSEKESIDMITSGCHEKVTEEDCKLLAKDLNYYPLEISIAMATINNLSAKSFFDVSPKDFLNKLKEETSTISGFVDYPIGKEPLRATTIFRVFTLALQTANYQLLANEEAINCILSFLAFISSDGIPIDLIHSWMMTSHSAPLLGVLKDTRKAKHTAATNNSNNMNHSYHNNGSSSNSSNNSAIDDIEYQIEVSCLFPRELGKAKNQSHKWKLFKSYNQIKDFYEMIKNRLSTVMRNKKFPPVYLFQGDAKIVSERRRDLHDYLTALSYDECWPTICEADEVKAFLGIHPEDDITSSSQLRTITLLEPLIAVNLVKIQHRGGLYNSNLFISCGMHRSLQCAARLWLQQNHPVLYSTLSEKIYSFLLSTIKSIESEMSDDQSLNIMVLLPHISSFFSTCDMEINTYELSEICYNIAKENMMFSDAEIFSNRCLFMTIKSYGKESTQAALWYSKVAETQQLQGKYPLGIKNYQLAIQVYESLDTQSNNEVLGQLYTGIAVLYQSQENYKHAEDCYTRAIRIFQTSDKCNNKDLCSSLNNLAYLKKIQGNYNDAKTLYEQALNVCTTLYGPHHELVATAINNLALLLKKLKFYEESKIYFRRAVAVYEHLYGGLIHIDVGQSMSSMAECLRGQSRYSEAEELHRSALDIFTKLFDGKSHPVIAQSQNALAAVLIDQGRFEEALVQYEKSLKIRKEVYGPNDQRVATSLNTLGQLLKAMCRLPEAKVYFTEALEIWRKGDHTDTATALNNLADILRAQGKYDEAQKLMDQALGVLRTAHGTENHADVAAGLMTMAGLMRDQGLEERARELYEQALEIRRKLYGDRHFAVADTLNKLADLLRTQPEKAAAAKAYHDEALEIYNHIQGGGTSPGGEPNTHQKGVTASALGSIASLLFAEGKYDEAQPMHEQALTILKAQYGENHPCVATALNNLASLLSAQGKFAEAQPMHEEALGILRRVYGEYQPYVATAYNNLGDLLYGQGKYDEALPHFQQALKCRRFIYGENNPYVAQSLNSLANLYRAVGNLEEALPLYEESLNIRKVHYGNDHPAVATALNNLGLLLKQQKQYPQAEELLRQSLQIRSDAYEDDHPAVAVGLNSLGMILHISGKFKEARKRYEAALVIRKDALGDEHPDVSNTMCNLADLSVDQSRLGQARKLYEEVIRIRVKLYGEKHPIVLGTRMKLHDLMTVMGILDEFNKNVKNKNSVKHFKESHKDFLVTIQDAEEEDEIVSHFLKMDAQAGTAAAEGMLNSHNEELEDAWSVDLRNRLGTEKLKLKQELGEIESRVIRIKSNVELTASELKTAEEEYNNNNKELIKLQLLPQKSKEHTKQIDKLLQLDSTLKDQKTKKESSYQSALSDLLSLEQAATQNRKKLQKVEEALPQLEEAQHSEIASRALTEKTSRDVAHIQEEIEYLKSKLDDCNGKDRALQDQLTEARNTKKSLEKIRDKAEEDHRQLLRQLVSFKMRVTGDADTEIDNTPNDESEPNVAATAKATITMKAKIKRKSANEEEDNDELLKDEVTDSDEEGGSNAAATGVVGDDSDLDNSNNAPEKKTLLAILKKKVKKQRVLIKMLKSQLITSGMKPIEEVITFEKAEEKLKETLGRLLMGDERASEEYDKWDHFVRNHPEYKMKEDRLSSRWKREHEPLNNAALRCIRTLVPSDIVTKCTLLTLESKLPKAAARRVWTKKSLWLTRMDVNHIAKLHIADLQSKYSPQGLDELELRAVWASLPDRFENDPKGEKAQWRTEVLEMLKLKRATLPWSSDVDEYGPSKKEVEKVLLSIDRNIAYKEMPSLQGPFDPESAIVKISQTSHAEVVVEDILTRKPRSLFEPLPPQSRPESWSSGTTTTTGKANPGSLLSQITSLSIDDVEFSPPRGGSLNFGTPKLSNADQSSVIGKLFQGASPKRTLNSSSLSKPSPMRPSSGPVMGPSFITELKQKVMRHVSADSDSLDVSSMSMSTSLHSNLNNSVHSTSRRNSNAMDVSSRSMMNNSMSDKTTKSTLNGNSNFPSSKNSPSRKK